MIANRTRNAIRSGTATVEAAVVLMFVMVPLMIGIWEIGRLVFCQQVIVTACREGARLAAQGKTVNSSGTPTNINISSGSPNVKETVFFSLVTGGLPGLDRTYVMSKINFVFTAPLIPTTSGGDPTEPSNAQKGQTFRISLTLDWDRVRWVDLGILRPSTIYYQVDWRVLVDEPFNVSTVLPTWGATP